MVKFKTLQLYILGVAD